MLVTIDNEVKVESNAGLTLKQAEFSMPPLKAKAAALTWQRKNKGIEFHSGNVEKKKNLLFRADGELTGQTPSFSNTDKKVQLSVAGKALNWHGAVSFQAGNTAKEPSFVQTTGRLAGEKIAVTLADSLDYKQGKLQAKGKSKISLGPRLTAGYDGSFELAQTEVKTAVMESAGENIHWQGKTDFTLPPDNKALEFLLDGSLKSNVIQVNLMEPGLFFEQQALDISTKGSLVTGDTTAIQGTASLTSAGFSMGNDAANDAKNNALFTMDEFSAQSIEAPGGSKLSIKELGAKGLQTEIAGNLPLRITIPEIALTRLTSDDLKNFNAAALLAQSPLALATRNKKKLAAIGSIELRNIDAGLDRHVTVDRVNFDELFFLEQSAEKNRETCHIDEAGMFGINWNPGKDLRGDSLSFAGLFCTIVREKDGSFTLSKDLASMRKPVQETAETAKDDADSPGADIQLSQVTLHGKSGIHFEDYTLPVPFISDLDITTLQVKNINSGKAEEAFSVNMTGVLDKRAPLTISGNIAPFARNLYMKMQVKLKNYPLEHLSAYTIKSVGVALASGQLKINSKINVKDRTLDMQNELLLKKLKTSTVSKELAEELDNQLPIPLNTALSVLRDSKGNISLDVPVSGPLDELDVGISDIIITALGKAILPAASGYLMYTLGPYGALAWVGMKVGEKMLEVRLPPVEFAPEESRLPEGMEDYFERLAKILADKPKEEFQLCPKSSAWEMLSLTKQKKLKENELELSDRDRKKLMRLGQERAENIRDYLVNEYGIDQDRLLICITRIEMEKDAKPRVDIQM